MDDLIHDDDLLVRYLDNELSADERAELESRLRNDSGLRERLTNLQVATEAIKQYGTAQQVSTVHSEMMSELSGKTNSDKSVGIRRMVRITMAIAASILIVFIGIRLYLSSQVSAETLYEDAFVDFQVSVSRGSAQDFSTIEKAYQAKNYNGVVQSIRSTRLDSKDSLLVGLSYLHVQTPAQAISILQRLASADNDFRQDAEFYLALAYLKNKEQEKALPLVEKISGNPMHLYYERFDNEFFEKLKKLSAK